MPQTGSRRSPVRPTNMPSVSRRLCAEHRGVEPELVGDEAGEQEPLSHQSTAGFAELAAPIRVFEEFESTCGAFFDGVDEESAPLVLELEGNASGAARRRRGSLPERFRDHQPEALAERFLDHDLGDALESVDLDVADAGEIGEHVDAVIVAGCVLDLAVDVPALGVVEGHRADNASWRSGISSRTSRYAAMTPSGSFQGSKRDTWVMRGRVVSTPIHSSTRAVRTGPSSKFLGLWGSIAGGMISTRATGKSGGTKPPRVKTAAS